jgi:ubiquinone/menaquinone biosynthesis C-methylase UbiE
MDQDELYKSVAHQLRKPHGAFALTIGEKMNESNAQMNRWAIEQIKPQPKQQILEIGMGNGLFVQEILNQDASIQYTGYDFSAPMINAAIQNNEEMVSKGRAQFHLIDVEEMPILPEFFDTVFTVNTLYFWSNPSKVLNNIHQTLKPSGQLTIAIRPKSVMQLYPFTAWNFTLYSKEELVVLLNKHQFKVNNIFEADEPNQEISGVSVPLSTLIVSANKTNT